MKTKLTILTITIHPAIDKIISIPRLRENDMTRARIELLYGGGKGNNVARALSRLGVSVIAGGFQGGYSGKFISQELRREGISTDFIECHQPTRTTLQVHEVETGKVFAIYEPGQEVEMDEIERLKRSFVERLSTCELCLLCGSAQTPLVESIFRELIELAHRRNVRCVLDSSGKALSLGIGANPTMVKVNAEELAEHVGYELGTLDLQKKAIQQLQAGGIKLAALSLGSKGMLLSDGIQIWQGYLKMDRVINTMGCGDSSLAGLAMAVIEQKEPAEMLRAGIACGAANTQVMGAGFIDPILVKELMPKVEIYQL